jgi:hypothetical protein
MTAETSVYGSEEARISALWVLQKDLQAQADNDSLSYPARLAFEQTADRLRGILNRAVAAESAPEEPDPRARWDMGITVHPDTMAVYVALPRGVTGPAYGEGSATVLEFNPAGGPTAELVPLTRAIVGAMLDHAREQLDG